MYKKYAVIAALLLLLTACSKREAVSERTYYADLSVTVSKLPGTPDTDVYLDDQLLGTLAPEAPLNIFRVVAGTKGKLSLYSAGTKNLIADTLISIAKNSKVNVMAINSETLGMKGWLPNTKVAPDVISMQMFYQLDEHYPEVVDMYIYAADNSTLELFDTGIVLRGLTRNKLFPEVINLPLRYREDGGNMIYVCKIKAPGSNEWIWNRAIDMDIVPITRSDMPGAGKFGIYIIQEQYEYIGAVPIYL